MATMSMWVDEKSVKNYIGSHKQVISHTQHIQCYTFSM